jgi:hypothetical protein
MGFSPALHLQLVNIYKIGRKKKLISTLLYSEILEEKR